MALKSPVRLLGSICQEMPGDDGGQEILLFNADRYRSYLLMRVGLGRFGRCVRVVCRSVHQMHRVVCRLQRIRQPGNIEV